MTGWLTHDLVMLALGLATNHILILSEMSAGQKRPVHPLTFIRERPYKAVLTVIGAVVGYVAVAGTDVSPVMVFGVGYLANDVLDRIEAITAQRLKP